MEQTFGSILRNEREKLGFTLEQATAATRVRAKILATFEANDFESMPPRGYAQNMIGSYARFLGLDPQKLIDLYLDELDTFESEHSFDDNPYSYYGHSARVGSVKREPGDTPSPRSGTTGRMRHTTREQSDTVYSRSDGTGPLRRAKRDSNHEVRPTRRYRTYGAEEPASEPTASTVRRNRSVTADNSAPKSGRVSHSNRIFSKKRTGAFSGYSRGEGMNRKKLIAIGIGVIVVIVLALILGSCVSSCSKSKTSAQSTTPTTTASSMASGTASTQNNEAATTVQTTPATPMTVSFSLPENTTSTMEVVVDGSPAYSATAIGPVMETYSVTQSIQMTIGSPSNVTVTKNGEVINIDNEEGTGYVDLSVTS